MPKTGMSEVANNPVGNAAFPFAVWRHYEMNSIPAEGLLQNRSLIGELHKAMEAVTLAYAAAIDASKRQAGIIKMQ